MLNGLNQEEVMRLLSSSGGNSSQLQQIQSILQSQIRQGSGYSRQRSSDKKSEKKEEKKESAPSTPVTTAPPQSPAAPPTSRLDTYLLLSNRIACRIIYHFYTYIQRINNAYARKCSVR